MTPRLMAWLRRIRGSQAHRNKTQVSGMVTEYLTEGMRCLYDPRLSDLVHQAGIIFVDGLTGNPSSMWTRPKNKTP